MSKGFRSKHKKLAFTERCQTIGIARKNWESWVNAYCSKLLRSSRMKIKFQLNFFRNGGNLQAKRKIGKKYLLSNFLQLGAVLTAKHLWRKQIYDTASSYSPDMLLLLGLFYVPFYLTSYTIWCFFIFFVVFVSFTSYMIFILYVLCCIWLSFMYYMYNMVFALKSLGGGSIRTMYYMQGWNKRRTVEKMLRHLR